MLKYGVTVHITVEAEDLADAYVKVADFLGAAKKAGEVRKVDVSDKVQAGGTWNGHSSGCRMADGRRSGTCTCGPVPR